MTALLGQPMMSVGGLMRLEAGDVLPMNVGEGVTVKVEENPIFIGEIGEISGKTAISLQKRI